MSPVPDVQGYHHGQNSASDHHTRLIYTGKIVAPFDIAHTYVEKVWISNGCYQPNRLRITAAPRQQSERKGRVRQPPGALPAFTAHKDTSNKLLLVIAKVASQRKQAWVSQREIYVCLVCALT